MHIPWVSGIEHGSLRLDGKGLYALSQLDGLMLHFELVLEDSSLWAVKEE